MREPVVIHAGRLVRPADMSRDDWSAALARHRRARRWTRTYKLRDEISDMMRALLADADDIDDARIAAVRSVALAALQAAEATNFAGEPKVAESIRRLRERLSRYAGTLPATRR